MTDAVRAALVELVRLADTVEKAHNPTWDAAWNAARAALSEQPEGEVVVTKNVRGQIVAVTRQDEDGRILSVISESAYHAPGAWQPIETAPRDGTPIIGWCVHAADPYYLEDGKRLTIYGGHTEGLGHVEDGPHVVVWGGAFDDRTWEAPGAWMPDWWFQYGSSFEVTANPTHWIPLPAPPVKLTHDRHSLRL